MIADIVTHCFFLYFIFRNILMNRLILLHLFPIRQNAFHAFDSELLIYILTVHYYRKNPDLTSLSLREAVGGDIEA